jgi:hypothetical protein
MDHVAARLTTSVESFWDRARQERTDELQAVRAQRLVAAEEVLVEIQTAFVNRAEAEIRGLQDGDVGTFVDQLAGKVEQYEKEAMAAFGQKFTHDQWQHIKDKETYLRGKLMNKVDAKLQEVTVRQSTLNHQQYLALLAQQQEQERQMAALRSDLERERREKAERERLAQITSWVGDIVVTIGGSREDAVRKIPPGYRIVEQDLCQNTKRRGCYVYLGYSMTNQIHQAVTHVSMEAFRRSKDFDGQCAYVDGWGCPYQRILTDLNSGAGGDWVYVAFTRVPFRGAARVTAIGAVINDGGQPPLHQNCEWVCWRNSSSPADANKGAGGRYIWLWIQKE